MPTTNSLKYLGREKEVKDADIERKLKIEEVFGEEE